MKRKVTKRNQEKFVKVSAHKRRAREKSRQEIIRALESINVGFDGFQYSEKNDTGSKKTRKTRNNEKRILGTYSGSRSGFGFVAPEENRGMRDVFIPEGASLGAIDGDFVECVYHSFKLGRGEEKTEGRVTKILQIGRKTVIGTLSLERSQMRGRHRAPEVCYLIPDDDKINLRPVVRDMMGASGGDKVEATVLRGTGTGFSPFCEIVRVFGSAEGKDANYMAVLAESKMPLEFSGEELLEAERVASEKISDAGRARYPGAVIFTMDGEGAKDLDDAVSIRKLGDGYRLGVHIADVSHYVREKTPLDRCVNKRGTSVYFTDKVVPMLPPVLSNMACSLNAGEEKYAISALIDLSSDGEILDLKLEKSIITSRVRGVYSEINKILAGTADKGLKEKYHAVIPSLQKMHALYDVLKKKSQQRGALELEVAEAEILLGESGEPTDIIKRERGVAERMIEQFMLTANEAVATLLFELKIPCVYRVHEAPPEDKIRELLRYSHSLGLDIRGLDPEKIKPRELAGLLGEASQKGILSPLSYTMLRSLSKAHYSEVNSAHFGLAIEKYCHFTSPIRRLSDLATHRIITRCLFEGKNAQQYRSYASRAAAIASDTEERAVATERRIENLYKTVYMQSKLGAEMCGMISSVTRFGLFVELDNTCEGLIPISCMPGVFTYDEISNRIYGSGLIFRIGDRVNIRVEEADISRGKLRFSLVL